MAAFDEPFWPPLWLLAWGWFRDETVLDTKLSVRRLDIRGAIRKAPVEAPKGIADLPSPKMLSLSPYEAVEMVRIVEFEPVPPQTNIDPTLATAHQVETDILRASRQEQIECWGRRPDSNRHEKFIAVDFVDARIEYDKAQLVRRLSGRETVIGYDLVFERCSCLRLFPALATPELALSPPSTTPTPPPAQSEAEKQRRAVEYYANSKVTGKKPTYKEFGGTIGLKNTDSIKRIWFAAERDDGSKLPELTRSGEKRRP
jgi:hypothetical protein